MAQQNRPRRRRAGTRRTTSMTPVAATAGEVVVRTPEAVDWKTEYAYVFRDLRVLGVVSGAIFVLLFVAGWLI